MRRNVEALVLFIYIESDIALLRIWCRQNRVIRLRVYSYKAFQIRISLYCVYQSHLVEVIDISPILKHDDNPGNESKRMNLLVLGQTNCPNLSLETQLTDTLECHVVPEEYFVRWELGPLSATYEC